MNKLGILSDFSLSLISLEEESVVKGPSKRFSLAIYHSVFLKIMFNYVECLSQYWG